ncbi:MAG: hypothetical protein QOJ99_5174, partial [Bryobacterales bacterium]|nr:hypothetical protein [Bryobacterales bacterium]
ELLGEIGNVIRHADDLPSALTRIQSLLASHCGGALLIIRPASSGAVLPAVPAVYAFLESRQYPFRGLYMAPVNSGGRAVGTLLACIGTWGAPGDLLARITVFVGQQLTALARRLALPSIEYAEAA